MSPIVSRESVDGMKVADLREALGSLGVSIPSSTKKKADLRSLLLENLPADDPPGKEEGQEEEEEQPSAATDGRGNDPVPMDTESGPEIAPPETVFPPVDDSGATTADADTTADPATLNSLSSHSTPNPSSALIVSDKGILAPAAPRHDVVSQNHDGFARFGPLLLSPHPAAVTAVRFSPPDASGKYRSNSGNSENSDRVVCEPEWIAAGCVRGGGVLWRLARDEYGAGEARSAGAFGTGRSAGKMLDLDWTSHGSIVVATADGYVDEYDVETFVHTRRHRGHRLPVHGVSSLPRGSMGDLSGASVTVGDDATLRVWDPRAPSAALTCRLPCVHLCVASSGPGATVAAAGLDRTVRIWDLRAAGASLMESVADTAAGSAAVGRGSSHDRDHDSWVRCDSRDSGLSLTLLRRPLVASRSPIAHIALSSTALAFSALDGSVSHVDLGARNGQITILRGGNGGIRGARCAVRLARGGARVVAGGVDRAVSVYRTAAVPAAVGGGVSSSGDRVPVGDDNAAPGIVAMLPGHAGAVLAVDVAGDVVASGGADGAVWIGPYEGDVARTYAVDTR